MTIDRRPISVWTFCSLSAYRRGVMKFVSSRELRINPGAVWKRLRQERDLVITSNGKPMGVLIFATEDTLEEVLATLRQERAQAAAVRIRSVAAARGLDKLSDERLEGIVGEARRVRRASRKAVAGGRS
jgi:prevent-host-death family protein